MHATPDRLQAQLAHGVMQQHLVYYLISEAPGVNPELGRVLIQNSD